MLYEELEEEVEMRVKLFKAMMGYYVTDESTDWLVRKGFFTAPASRKYHGAYPGGLFDHCYLVAKVLQDLTKNNKLEWEEARSPLIVGMFHDLCKIDLYVEDEEVGKYTYSDAMMMGGHGDKSVIYLSEHMRLTNEEIMCIRWHMGAFDEKENWKFYSGGVRKYPNVLWTHTADMIASQIMGV